MEKSVTDFVNLDILWFSKPKTQPFVFMIRYWMKPEYVIFILLWFIFKIPIFVHFPSPYLFSLDSFFD